MAPWLKLTLALAAVLVSIAYTHSQPANMSATFVVSRAPLASLVYTPKVLTW